MEAVSATQGRAILTVLGSDRAGIVAAITQVLANHAALSVEFDALKEELDEVAKSLGVQVMLQREDVFRFMYRL